jgi:hypothetical protein
LVFFLGLVSFFLGLFETVLGVFFFLGVPSASILGSDFWEVVERI